MLDAGFRKSEICKMDKSDIDLESHKCVVMIKGGRWGEGVFSELTNLYLREWFASREKIAKCEAAFISTQSGKRLTSDGLSTIVKQWGKKIDIILSPHDLRRTFAVLSTLAGAPARTLQVAGRWSNISIVEHYTQAITAEAFRRWFPVSFVMEN
jgi:site-specific recombinase XerC